MERKLVGALYLLVPLLLTAACSDSFSGTRDVLVISPQQELGHYQLEVAEVSADSFSRLEGEFVRFLERPSVEISVDGQDMELLSEDPMDVDYIEDAAVLVASDYFGLLAVTAYHHFNTAGEYFRARGLSPDAVPQLPVFFYPSFQVGASGVNLTDNMAFAFPLPSFWVLREVVFDDIPLATNQGIVAHEYSHAVLNFLSLGAGGERAEVAYRWNSASTNYWGSLHEGIADIHGAAVSKDPNFMVHSTGNLIAGRDLREMHVASETDLQSVADAAPSNYDPYPLGSVLAATYWSYALRLQDSGLTYDESLEAMGKLALDAVGRLELSDEGFHIRDFLIATRGLAEDSQWCPAVQRHFPSLAEGTGC